MLRFAPLLLVLLIVPIAATSIRVNPRQLEAAQLACQQARVEPASAAFTRCVERHVTGATPDSGKPVIRIHPPGATTTGTTTTTGTPVTTTPAITTPTTTAGGALGAAQQHCQDEELNPGSPSFARCVQDQLGSSGS